MQGAALVRARFSHPPPVQHRVREGDRREREREGAIGSTLVRGKQESASRRGERKKELGRKQKREHG